MKKFLIVALMLAVSLIFYQGVAEAIPGVADKVPGSSVVIPFFCDKDGAGENTLWTIAALQGSAVPYIVYDVWSDKVYDNTEDLTNYDLKSDDCLSLTGRMSPASRDQLSVPDQNQYQGYIVYRMPGLPGQPVNNLFGWSYIVDLSKGFASSGIVLEVEDAQDFCESDPSGNPLCISAWAMFPRYYIHNDNPESTTNLIFLVGANGTIFDPVNICNNEEECPSITFPRILEVSKIDVRPLIPDGLFDGYPKGGFFIMGVNGPGRVDTIVGISHQKAQANTVEGTWDVTHEIHRVTPPPTVD
ncbi:MAG: hypothetical protein QXT99_09760 [Candidatus Nitrosotenuis sp.]